MKRNVCGGLAVLALATLAACGGGGGGGSTAGAGGSPSSASLGVTPSLGQFSLGTVVNAKRLDGTLISTDSIAASGAITINVGTHTGPVIVEVVGAPGRTYYDEGTQTQQPFGAGKVLRAALPSPLAQIGVSMLTEAAVARLESQGALSGATASTINDANAKVAAVFGLPDILIAPTPVNGTSANLNLATPGDKYALVLAALAKTAGSGKNALVISAAMAEDMKDGKLDGMNGVTVVTNSPTPSAVAAAYQTAAAIFADASSQLVVANLPLVITPDVTAIAAQSNQSDINLAKAMFADLRTTARSLTNAGSTGFLDNQAQRITNDASGNAFPQLNNASRHLKSVYDAADMFAKTKANFSSFGSATDYVPTVLGGAGPGTTFSFIPNGQPINVWYGDYAASACYSDANGALNTALTCFHTFGNDVTRYTGTTGKMVFYKTVLTNTGTNQFTYATTRMDVAVSVAGGTLSLDTNVTPGSLVSSAGTIQQVGTGTSLTQLAITGNVLLSPAQNGTDSVNVTMARTALAGTDNYRYAMAGTIGTVGSGTGSIALASGSQFDVNTTSSNPYKLLAVKLVGEVQTTDSKLVGTLDFSGFADDKSGSVHNVPSSMSFTGSAWDLTSGGAGQFLTGTVVGTTTGYSNYYANQPTSASNFYLSAATFTGTIAAPSRPVLTLVMGSTRTGFNTNSATVSYSYGTKSITGSGTVYNDGTPTVATVSNQDGITYNVATGKLTKNGAELATIVGGMVHYKDGVTESMQ